MESSNLWTFLGYLNALAGYASIVAIESPSKLDDEQWLAYWILYSFLTLMEMVFEPILSWIPMWHQIKVAFAAWLVLPQFRGASFIYERFVRDQLRRHGVRLMGTHPPPMKVEEEAKKN
ncbi:HVA22-like protein e isoform X2 [Canna indica]|uniref:HVA22-like protein n=1 Tax=Canna indica TaxID=4628 RepID=A0AAQ3QDF2_9LILI|nr:HVA22-like protein e isoform X2 [Canna indica]